LTLPAPWSPLVSGGEGLETYPGEASALQARMAQIYGVASDWQVLAVRGPTPRAGAGLAAGRARRLGRSRRRTRNPMRDWAGSIGPPTESGWRR